MAAWRTQTHLKEQQTVLIASEDSKMVAAWDVLFKQRNCRVVHEACPRHALQAARLISPTLVIVDLDLSQPERLALCRELRPFTHGALLLLASAASEEEASAYYAAGVDECLSAIVSPLSLLSRCMVWLARQDWYVQRQVLA